MGGSEAPKTLDEATEGISEAYSTTRRAAGFLRYAKERDHNQGAKESTH